MLYENYKDGYHDEPIVYYCGKDTNIKPGAKYGPVIRDIYIVECCTEGKGGLIVNGNEFAVESGSGFILLPGDTVMHLTDTVEPRKGMWCAIDGFSLKSILQQAGITAKTPFIPPEAFEATLNELNILYSMRDCTDPGADLRRAGSVYNILGALLKSSGASSKNAWIQKAIGIMEARYNEEISIEDIAGETGLERTYFSTLFKSTTGLSPNAFLTQLRIRKASVLLKESSATVTEISTSVGLDPQNFSRFFKRATGMTPKEYAKKFSQNQKNPSKQ